MQSQESQMTRPSGHRPPTRYTVFSGIDISPDVGRKKAKVSKCNGMFVTKYLI